MKICVINDHFSMSSGGQHRIQNLSRGFEALGHEVLYVCPYGISTEVSDLFIKKTQSYQSLMYPKYISPYFSDFFKIFKKIIAYHIKCDFFVIGLPNTMMKSLNALYGTVEGIPVAFDFGGLWASSFDKGKMIYGAESRWLRTVRPFAQLYEDILAMLSSRLPDLITVPSTPMKILLERYFRTKVKVIYHPLDVYNSFNPESIELRRARKLVPRKYREKELIMIAVKGDRWFIPIICKLIEEIKRFDAAFLILGSYPLSEHICKKKGLDDYLFFTGNVPYNLVPYYLSICKFTIILTPPQIKSIWYAPHNISKIADSLAMGKPIITDALAAIDYVLNSRAGFLVSNLDELIDKLILLLQNSEDVSRLGSNARRFACEKLDHVKVAREYINLLQC